MGFMAKRLVFTIWISSSASILFSDEQIGEGLCGLFLVNEFVFVLTKLAFDDLFYQVNGYVHITAGFFGTDNATLNRDGNLDLLFVFLYAERYDDFCIRNEVRSSFPIFSSMAARSPGVTSIFLPVIV